MSTTPKFSIIVPVYKAEKFIHNCIEGILAQTVTDFELILVNDGSPDRSSEICEEYAKKDRRIKVFHKENGGPSSARNIGLDKAIGEYICFADSDDVVDNSFLEHFGTCDTDITVQGIFLKDFDEEKEHYQPIKDGVYDRTDIKSIINNLYEARNTGYLVTRAFKRKIIENNRLRLNEKYRVREDEEFIWRYMCYCQTFATVDKGAYHYDMPNFGAKYSFVDIDSDFECTKSIVDNTVLLFGGTNNPVTTNNINRMASIALNSYRDKDFNLLKTKEYLKTFCHYYNSGLSFKSKLIYYAIGKNTPNILHKLYNKILK